jgi:hypothetical protein
MTPRNNDTAGRAAGFQRTPAMPVQPEIEVP